MEDKDKVISFEGEIANLAENLHDINGKYVSVNNEIKGTEILIESVWEELREISDDLLFPNVQNIIEDEYSVKSLDDIINDCSSIKLKGDIHLTTLDVLAGIIAGIIASIIDIVFVGTPEVVKIYKGGENFDGSILTGALRKIGNGDNKLSQMFKWLSEKCKVPYDISAEKDVVIPNNHRLRSFGHDPLIGLLFAVVDIIMGTATVVDNKGRLRVLINSRQYPGSQKFLAVFYYLGHLLSDVCTARGLPIPGFIMTQFFAGDDTSIARIAEQMYKDGYDLRHLASMTTPVYIKNMITDVYYRMCIQKETKIIGTIAEKQICENRKIAYKYKLRLISDTVSCGGNVLKFFIPPTMGNVTALNLPEWTSLIKDTAINLKYQMREKNIENLICNREIISDNWRQLLME